MPDRNPGSEDAPPPRHETKLNLGLAVVARPCWARDERGAPPPLAWQLLVDLDAVVAGDEGEARGRRDRRAVALGH